MALAISPFCGGWTGPPEITKLLDCRKLSGEHGTRESDKLAHSKYAVSITRQAAGTSGIFVTKKRGAVICHVIQEPFNREEILVTGYFDKHRLLATPLPGCDICSTGARRIQFKFDHAYYL